MSQFRPTQLGGDGNFQIWQMHKQLQELRKQQQLQVENGTHMQNSVTPFHPMLKPTSMNHQAAMQGNVPSGDQRSWQNNFMGGDPRLAADNAVLLNHGGSAMSNFSNGSLYLNSQAQAQSLRSGGPSFYPTVDSSRDSFGINENYQNAFQHDHGFHEQGIPNACSNFHGKFNALSKSLPQSDGTLSALTGGLGMGQKEVDCSNNLGTVSGGASLDPAEEKLLFGTDDINWGAFAKSGQSSLGPLDGGNSSEFAGFPSLQSGSWSALMQEALQSSSSEAGLQEEWSGLAFRKTENLMSNNSNVPDVRDANQNNLARFQHSPAPLTEPQKMFSQSSNNPMPMEVSNGIQFHQNLVQGHSVGYGIQGQMQLSNGVWPQQQHAYELAGHNPYPGRVRVPQQMHGHNSANEAINGLNSWSGDILLHNMNVNNAAHMGSSGQFGRIGGVDVGSFKQTEQPKPDGNNRVMQVEMLSKNQLVDGRGQIGSENIGSSRGEMNALNSGAQSFNQIGQHNMGMHMMRSDIIGSMGMNAVSYPPNLSYWNQFQSNSPHQLPNNSEQMYSIHKQASGSANFGKEREAATADELRSRRSMHSNDSSGSFGGSTASPHNRAVQSSQTMLELLHKASSPAISNDVSEGRSVAVPDGPMSQRQLSQSPMHEFGLKLAPPVEKHTMSTQVCSTETYMERQQLAFKGGMGDMEQLTPAPSGQALTVRHPAHQPQFQRSETENLGQLNTAFTQATPSVCSEEFKSTRMDIPAAQQLTGVPHNNKIAHLQSMLFQNNASNANLLRATKTDQLQRGGSMLANSSNMHKHELEQVLVAAALHSSLEKGNLDSTKNEIPQKHTSDQSMLGNVAPSILAKGSDAKSPAENAAATGSAPGGDSQLVGRTHSQGNIPQQNYSLFHQIQAMRYADFDPNTGSRKKLKGAEVGSDASQPNGMTGQAQAGGTQAHVSSATNLPTADVTGKQVQQSNVHILNSSSLSNTMRRGAWPNVSPQMAPTWFGQYANRNSTHGFAMFSAPKTPVPTFNLPKASQETGNADTVDTQPEGSHADRIDEHDVSMSTKLAVVPADTLPTVVARGKRPRVDASDKLPWRKVIKGPRKLQSMSVAETEWAAIANRLTEKADDDAEMLEDGPIIPLPQRRIILTTQLMQQLVHAIPEVNVRLNSTSGLACERIIYPAAKSVLGDACGMLSSLESDSSRHSHIDNNVAGAEGAGRAPDREQRSSKFVEFSVERLKQMESVFTRVSKRTSLSDVQLECQELERFSIANRMGRFHARSYADSIIGQSTPENSIRRIPPQWQVTAFPVPVNPPEGSVCLQL